MRLTVQYVENARANVVYDRKIDAIIKNFFFGYVKFDIVKKNALFWLISNHVSRNLNAKNVDKLM